jgi:hypothetical protein
MRGTNVSNMPTPATKPLTRRPSTQVALRWTSDRGGELEDRPHHGEEDERADDRRCHPAIYLVGHGEAIVAGCDGGLRGGVGQPGEPVVVEEECVVGVGRGTGIGHRVGKGCTDGGGQGDQAGTAPGIRRDHGTAERLR